MSRARLTLFSRAPPWPGASIFQPRHDVLPRRLTGSPLVAQTRGMNVMTQAPTSVTVDIVSDVIRPWCFLGKRRFDKAIAALDGTSVRHPTGALFCSIPRFPSRGCRVSSTSNASSRRTGSRCCMRPSRPQAMRRVSPTPSTRSPSRRTRSTLTGSSAGPHAPGRQHEMAERLFQLYWLEGADIGQRDVLINDSG